LKPGLENVRPTYLFPYITAWTTGPFLYFFTNEKSSRQRDFRPRQTSKFQYFTDLACAQPFVTLVVTPSMKTPYAFRWLLFEA